MTVISKATMLVFMPETRCIACTRSLAEATDKDWVARGLGFLCGECSLDDKKRDEPDPER